MIHLSILSTNKNSKNKTRKTNTFLQKKSQQEFPVEICQSISLIREQHLLVIVWPLRESFKHEADESMRKRETKIRVEIQTQQRKLYQQHG